MKVSMGVDNVKSMTVSLGPGNVGASNMLNGSGDSMRVSLGPGWSTIDGRVL